MFIKYKYYLKYFFIIFLILIFIKIKNDEYFKNNLYKNSKLCICTLGKEENKYIREFVEYYKNLGVDKIFLYDNNNINGEHFEEVINDYIKKEYVDIINYRGIQRAHPKAINDCYINNNKEYNWLMFYDIDEYIHLSGYTNIKIFLNQEKFNIIENFLLQ